MVTFRADNGVPQPQGQAPSRELMILRRRLGGELGELEVGGERISGVLKLDASNFVLPKPAGFITKRFAELAGADLHDAKDHKDALLFERRYRRTYGRA